MGSKVLTSHLRRKFSSTLMEAEADLSSYSQIISSFKSIERLMNTMSQNSSTMVNLLYDLIDSLSECTIFVHEQRTAAASKKFFKFIQVLQFQANMRSRLDKIKRDLENCALIENPNGTPELVIQPDASDLVTAGFKSQLGQIEGFLMPTDTLGDGAIQEERKQFNAVGIVGMCGCGKTALARKVFASSIVEKCYFPRVWVSLSKALFDNDASDLRARILKHILTEIGHDSKNLDNGDYSVAELLGMLHLRLTGKRYLIVLDDVWRKDEWFEDLACSRGQPGPESFTHGLPKLSGGAIIVTSRGEDVIKRMVGEKHVIRPSLSDDPCWAIFSNALRQKKINPDHPKLFQMKESIINNCRGLPLAAKTLANVISNLLSENNEVRL